MDLYAEYLSEQAASHYEITVFNEDVSTVIQNTKQTSFSYAERD